MLRAAFGRNLTVADIERVAWPLFGAAAASAAALIIWLGRGVTFSNDDLVVFMQSPGLGLGDALEPFNGHLVLTLRLVYHGVLEGLGADYLPFRLLAVAGVVSVAALFFIYASPRIGRAAALPPCLILLAFGADYRHVLAGNGFGLLLVIALGLATLLALDRRDRAGDIGACAMLCLAVATYSVALAFTVGAAVLVLLHRDRWRRIWIVAIPLVLYAIWWVWALDAAQSSEGSLTLTNLLVVPAWAFQSLASTISALVGIDYSFDDSVSTQAGTALALVALIALALRLRQGPVSRLFWAAGAIAVTLWLMGALYSAGFFRTPASPRYLYPTAIAVLLMAVEAAAGMRWNRHSLTVLYAAAAFGLAANIVQLRDGRTVLFDDYTVLARAELAGLEIAGPNANPAFAPESSTALLLSFAAERELEPPTGAYLRAAARYGGVGYSVDQVRRLDDDLRARTDATLAAATGMTVTPPQGDLQAEGCVSTAGSEPQASTRLPPGSVGLIEAAGAPVTVSVRRFADGIEQPVGTLPASAVAELTIPPDDVPDPWIVSASDPAARVCEVG